MELPIYQVDAFTDARFAGNPAAVVVMDEWLPDATLQAIAQENNLAETAFVIIGTERVDIRWFAPEVEIALCGHATLASAKVLFDHYLTDWDEIPFDTRMSGALTVKREGEFYILDFPADMPKSVEPPEGLFEALDTKAYPVLKGKTDLVVRMERAEEVLEVDPDFKAVARLDARGVICTAPGTSEDFVSRFFAPACGVDEDPVTGSAHTVLTPYWAKTLNKRALEARQLSQRGGHLWVEHRGDRVLLKGQGVAYLQGTITV